MNITATVHNYHTHIGPYTLHTDVLKAKRANQERVKEFSKHLKEFNRKEISSQQRRSFDRAIGFGSDNDDISACKDNSTSNKSAVSKRDRALEYVL